MGDILDHEVMIEASRITPVDATLIPTGELRSVKGTPFDFTQPTPIGARIDENNEQLKLAHGYDDNFVLNSGGGSMALAARVREGVATWPAEQQRDVALVFIHAVNPYGFSQLRRVNEDNVDLNRNFRDFSHPPARNAAYAEVHAMMVPAEWPPTAENGAAIAAHAIECFPFLNWATLSSWHWPQVSGVGISAAAKSASVLWFSPWQVEHSTAFWLCLLNCQSLTIFGVVFLWHSTHCWEKTGEARKAKAAIMEIVRIHIFCVILCLLPGYRIR